MPMPVTNFYCLSSSMNMHLPCHFHLLLDMQLLAGQHAFPLCLPCFCLMFYLPFTCVCLMAFTLLLAFKQVVTQVYSVAFH